MSGSAAIPASMALSSAAVGSTGFLGSLCLVIQLHLARIGFAQADDAHHIAALNKHHHVQPVTDQGKAAEQGQLLGRVSPLPFQIREEAQGADVQTYIHQGGHELQQGEIAALKELFASAETQ